MKQQQHDRRPINPCWSRLTEGYLHDGIRRVVVRVGTLSATHPWTTVGLTILISLALLVTGYFTNFQMELNQLYFVTPTNSLPDIHSQWIQNTNTDDATTHQNSGFPNVRVFYLNIHANGDNVLHAKAMEVALEAMEVLQTTLHYNDLCRTCSECSASDREMLFDGTGSYCRISSVTQFWDHSLDKFQQQVQQLQLQSTSEGGMHVDVDHYVRQIVSRPIYPDGTPVYHEAILGKYEGYNTTSFEVIDYSNAPPVSLATLMEIDASDSTSLEMYLTSAKCLAIKLDIPDVGSSTDDFERQALQRLAELQQKYHHPPTNNDNTLQQVQVEYYTMNGYQYEMMRALYIDLPLVGVLVFVMVAFAVWVFSDRHDRVKSRGMVGLYSFTTIALSLIAGYGIMFILGVPITTLALLIPFVVCGVGLDDTFIITGTYFRLLRQQVEHGEGEVESEFNDHDAKAIKQERKRATTLRIVQATLNEIALSITMTTITTLLAFMTGGTSQIPAVRWLCWYSAISLFLVYLFQITCFIGLLVLDERRVQAKRKDLFIWIVVHDNVEDTSAVALEINEDMKEPSSVDENLMSTEERTQLQQEKSEEVNPQDTACSTVSTTSSVKLAKSSLPSIGNDDDDDDNNNNNKNSNTIWQISTTSQDDGEYPIEVVVHQEIDDVDHALIESTDQVNPQSLHDSESSDLLPITKATNSSDPLPMTKATNSLDPIPVAKATNSSKFSPSKPPETTFPERLMGWYAGHLLKPVSKVIVLAVFALYFGAMVYSTTLLRQEFQIKDYIPADSFMTSSMRAYEEYSTYLLYIEVYFRNVDQSDPEVQLQMSNYVQELSELDQIGDEPGFFWLRDFQLFVNRTEEELIGIDLTSLSFKQQVDLALSIPQLRQIYGRDIVRDPESGNITASRTSMFLREFDMYDVPNQLELLMDQREVSLRQPINDPSKLTMGDGGLNFFTFAELYFYWELFATSIDELTLNTVLCVVVVSVIAFVLVPHWSAVFFACPLLIMLYFNLMGTMQYCGITINVISYFILVLSIGLLVDFLMHILLRFYESKGATRNEKVKETLETMGTSILLGAFTTFLGVIPLAFSTTKIFKMFFVCFLAMVMLGCAAGLVLLPVLLSLVGPVRSVEHESKSTDSDIEEEAMEVATG